MVKTLFIWSCIGVATEVLFTAGYDALMGLGNPLWMGYSYVSMFPLYATLPFVIHCSRRVCLWYPMQILHSAVCAMASEFAYGWILHTVAVCPWREKYIQATPYHIMGLVRYDWFPLWCVYSVYMHWIYETITEKNDQ